MNTQFSHDLELLMTCKIIVENLNTNQPELVRLNPEWTKDFAINLSNRVERAFNFYLGHETNRETEQVRNKFNHIQAQALRAVAFLKTRIEVSYVLDSKRKNQVLDTLGFKLYLKAIHEKDSDKLLELLSHIKENLTDEIKKDLIKNESDRNFIDRITVFATKLQKVRQSQTSLLATKKAIAEQAKEIYNELLLDVLDICSEVTGFYKDKPEKANLFNYSMIAQKHFLTAERLQ